MKLAYVIESIVVLVIALFIFSYFTNPVTEYKTKQFLSSVKGKLNSNIQKIPTPNKISCEEKAKSLIPDVLLLSDKDETQVQNLWKDGTSMGHETIALQDCFRQGSKEGENVNYLYIDKEKRRGSGLEYLAGVRQCPKNFSYSKTIISKSGEILGTTTFVIDPIIRIKDKQMTFNYSYDKKSDTYYFNWDGFDDEMKKYFGVDKFKFKILKKQFRKTETICENESREIKGTLKCSGVTEFAKGKTLLEVSTYEILQLTEPDIYDNKVYEIIEPKIISCK